MSTTTFTPSAAVAKARPSSSNRSIWLGFLVVLAASVMDLLDSTIAQTAAPAIRRDLGGSYASLEWISAAYTLAMAVTLLLGSRLGDLFGRRRVLLAGIAGFVGASVLCSLAPSPGALIAGRAVQGAVAAIMVPQGFGLIRELFGDEGQQKAFGVFGPVMGLAAVTGPLVGGALVNLDLLGTGWRAIFLVNVPIGLLAIAAGRRYLPRTAPAAPGARLDAASVTLAMVGGFALVYPLIEGREHGWPAWSLALLGAGLVALAAFGVLQKRRARQGRTPLVEPSILGRRPYVAGLAVVLGFIGAMGGMMIALNVMFQTGLGLTPLACAVATVAIPVMAIGGSITSSALLARIGRTTMHIGIVVMAIGRHRAALGQRRRDRVGSRRPARDHRLRHGDGVRADVRRDPGRRRPARDRVRLGAARVDPATRDVDRDRRGRHRAVRSARQQPRAGRVRRRVRPRAPGRNRVPGGSVRRRVLAPQARAGKPLI
jgi:MFS family permease